MPPIQHNPDDVRPMDPRAVARLETRLRRAIAARTTDAANDRIERLLEPAESSLAYADALYFAAQRLRDLGELEQEEAVFLFEQVFQAREPSQDDDDDVEMTRSSGAFHKALALGGNSANLEAWFLRRLDIQFVERRAAFHRARGEFALADVSERDERAYADLWAKGEEWLIRDKPLGFERENLPADPSEVAVLLEKLIAFSAADAVAETRDWVTRMYGYINARGDTRDASQLAAIRQARAMGIITRAESAKLIDEVVGLRVPDLIQADRIGARLTRKLERFDATWDVGAPNPERDALDSERHERAQKLYAVELRRIGEHWMAELLLTDPETYEEMCED
jgi:hypothetical protein